MSEKIWFCVLGEKKVGPLSSNHIAKAFLSGRINGDTLLWKDGMADYVPLNKTSGYPKLLKLKAKRAPTQWQYFKNGDTLGPFSSSQLKGMFHAGQITEKTKIQKVGAETWESFFNSSIYKSIPNEKNNEAIVQPVEKEPQLRPYEKSGLSKFERIDGWIQYHSERIKRWIREHSMQITLGSGAVAILAVYMFFAAFNFSGGTIRLKQNFGLEKSPSSQEAMAPTQHWYEGGTLQDANASSWASASYANKLATAADFVAATKKADTMPQLREKSELLVTCLNKAASDPDLVKNETLYDVAVMCMAMMGW